MALTLLADLQSLEHIVDQFLAFVQGGGGRVVGRQAPLAVLAQSAPDLPLQRLLGNRIDNALACGQAPVRVELAAHDDGAVRRVLDQGLGMSQAEFELARQPFVRLSAARSDLGHCGLGRQQPLCRSLT